MSWLSHDSFWPDVDDPPATCQVHPHHRAMLATFSGSQGVREVHPRDDPRVPQPHEDRRIWPFPWTVLVPTPLRPLRPLSFTDHLYNDQPCAICTLLLCHVPTWLLALTFVPFLFIVSGDTLKITFPHMMIIMLRLWGAVCCQCVPIPAAKPLCQFHCLILDWRSGIIQRSNIPIIHSTESIYLDLPNCEVVRQSPDHGPFLFQGSSGPLWPPTKLSCAPPGRQPWPGQQYGIQRNWWLG